MKQILITICLAWAALGPATSSAEPSNQLANHPSPYLALHANDPVHWQDWGQEALERAQKEQKLVLVSIGYFSCHWCHVMQRESFSDAAIAARLNSDFISVKVDRELESVLDQRLMEFSQNINGIAGWPLNVFLTPEGYPLSGVVYLPPDEFHGYIDRLASRWDTQREQLGAAARELAMRQVNVQQELESTLGQPAVHTLAEGYVADALAAADKLQGGFGEQSKFPTAPRLMALLEIHRVKPRPEVAAFLDLTLSQMANLGLNDHVGGGFFRYTTDPDWHTPHFEKMLYDNALLAWLYLRAGEVLNEPRWREVGLATVRFMLRELAGGEGALIASLSAVDDKDVEGGFYLWRQPELQTVLTAEERAFANFAWGLDRPTQWEAGTLPMKLRTAAQLRERFSRTDAEISALERQVATKLRQTREKSRILPRDDKRLAGWNGLALIAVAEAARHAPEMKASGAALARFLERRLWDGDALHRAVDRDGRPLGRANLADHASVALGLLSWGEVADDARAWRLGARLLAQTQRAFHGPDGWREEGVASLPGAVAYSHLTDTALPSAQTLWVLGAKKSLQRQAEPELADRLANQLRAASRTMREAPIWYGSLIAASLGLAR